VQGLLDAALVIVSHTPLEFGDALLVEELAREAGINTATCLLTSVSGVRPPGGDWKFLPMASWTSGLAACRDLIAAYPRKIVLTLGERASKALGITLPLDEARGYVWPDNVLPTYHPKELRKQWMPCRALAAYDFAKARRLAAHDHAGAGGASVRLVTTPADGTACRAALHGASRLALDIEPRADGSVACLGLAADARVGWCVPNWESWQQELIREVCANGAYKCFHNGSFDMGCLGRAGITVTRYTDDTMILWHARQPTLAAAEGRSVKSLAFLASVLCDDEPWWKDYGYIDVNDQYRLCATDARVTFKCWERLCLM
jgi:hypothetical protein